jgi:hypothetical protein
VLGSSRYFISIAGRWLSIGHFDGLFQGSGGHCILNKRCIWTRNEQEVANLER